MNVWASRGDDHRLVESPRAELESEIDALDAVIDELAQLAEQTANDSVRLGAIKAKVDAQARRLELKRAAGMLPWNLRLLKYDAEVTEVAGVVLGVLKKYEVSVDARKEILAELNKRSLEHRRELAWTTTPLSIEPVPAGLP